MNIQANSTLQLKDLTSLWAFSLIFNKGEYPFTEPEVNQPTVCAHPEITSVLEKTLHMSAADVRYTHFLVGLVGFLLIFYEGQVKYALSQITFDQLPKTDVILEKRDVYNQYTPLMSDPNIR